MTRIAAPAMTIVIVVIAFSGLVGWNRSGQPRLVATLTERELPQSWNAPGLDDKSGRQLRIEIEYRHDPLDSRNWLPELRLRAIGFHFNVPMGAPEAADTYAKTPTRLAWVVFELDGPAWRDIERRRALQPEAQPAQQRQLQSRLVPVDAGPDFETLLARYPTGHLILRAVVGLTYLMPEHGGPLVYGAIRKIVPGEIAVPSHLRAVLDALPARVEAGPPLPRYEAELAMGRLGIPYLRGVRPLP